MDVMVFTERQIVVNKKYCPDKDNLKKYLIETGELNKEDSEEYDFDNVATTWIRYYPKTPEEFQYDCGPDGCWAECAPNKGAAECWMIMPIR